MKDKKIEESINNLIEIIKKTYSKNEISKMSNAKLDEIVCFTIDMETKVEKSNVNIKYIIETLKFEYDKEIN